MPLDEIEVELGSVVNVTPEDIDPFNTDIKKMSIASGASPAFRKNLSRLSKAYTGIDGAERKSVEYTFLNGYTAFMVVLPPYNLDYLARLFEISPIHRPAIMAKVSNIVGLGYDFIVSPAAKARLARIDNKKSVKREQQRLEDQKQQLLDMLDTFNSEDEFQEVLNKVWIDYESTGNGYLEIGRTVTGNIGYIGHIPSSTMRIRHQRDGFVQIVANIATFFRNFGDRTTRNPISNDEPNEVIHIKKYSPTNGYYGVPEIVSAKNAVAGMEFSDRFNLDYFENKAVPRYVIVLKGAQLSDNAQKNVLAFLQGNLRGQNHRSLYIPLPADTPDRKVDLEMKPIEAGIQDSSFDNYRKDGRSMILYTHRVPITKVGLLEGIALAAARDADKMFKEQVCRPEQRVFEKKLNRIFKEFTTDYLFKLNETTLTDEETQAGIDEKYLRMQTIVPNEIRARMGMSPIEGGDKVVVLNAQQQADQRATANQSRTRDAQRATAASDSAGNARNEQGAGRQVP